MFERSPTIHVIFLVYISGVLMDVRDRNEHIGK